MAMENLVQATVALMRRDSNAPVFDPNDPTAQFLKLLQDPFSTSLLTKSLAAAFGSSLGITAGIAVCFSFLRPYNGVVYAPKLKHADEKHAPPPLGKGVFAWIGPLWKTSEPDIVALAGLDAAIFLRFLRMCRNIFVILALLGCGILIPVNMAYGSSLPDDASWLQRIGPNYVHGDAHWATVLVCWLFNIVVCGFLWWNYRRILHLRRLYFESDDYQHSLHARTLMLIDIPKKMRSDEGIARIIDQQVPNSSFSRTAVARDVKILPELIAEHDKTVRKLEKVLAIYLKDPKNLPPARPVCEPSKKDRSYGTYPKGQKVDAIEYLTDRIRSLELEIKEVRQSVDKRGSMGYGFASYADISEAHAIAHILRKKRPLGAKVALAPRPNDIIWDNMPLSAATRRSRRLWNNLWIAVLTLLWIAPNAMIAIFLVSLANLGLVWPAFKTELATNQTFWSIVQGIASPAITSIVYLLLPIVFRRMSIRAGDQTKTGRERHVTAKLYAFFVVNNLIVFSIFSAIWGFTTGVVQKASNDGLNAWQAILKQNFGETVFLSLIPISPFWVSWLLQRQLGAAIDLAQLWTLFYSFIMRKFSSPTPRELIELTAPPPFDYASYYNYFLFYSTVALCYATIQPLVLPAAAMYFCIDTALKKYLLMYIFVTKTESGGMFWRTLFNRFIFGVFLSDLVVFLVTWVRGVGNNGIHLQAFCIAPLPFLLIAFKYYCARTFDDKIHFYATRLIRSDIAGESALNVKEQSSKNDRLAARFGHPALYKPLITPMVHAKAQNILASVYQGRLSDGREAGSGDATSVSGYSDTYVLDSMAAGKPGKVSTMPGFEVVPENRLDFEFYRNRDEFAADHGAGELFGKQSDLVRPGTPSTVFGGEGSRSGSPGPVGGMGFAGGRRQPPTRDYSTTSYMQQSAYGDTQSSAYPGHSPYMSPPLLPADVPTRTHSPLYTQSNESGNNLVSHAQGMPMSPPIQTAYPARVASPAARAPSAGTAMTSISLGNPRAPGMLGGGPYGYGGLPQEDDFTTSPPPVDTEPAQYDYFRGSRRRETRDTNTPGDVTRNGSSAWGGHGGR